MKGRSKKMKSSVLPLVGGVASLSMAALLLTTPSVAHAGPYTPVVNPVSPLSGPKIPPVERVPGKEYSHEFDKDAAIPAPNLDSAQNIMFDGSGGVADTFDYDGLDVHDPGRQVDAIANQGDDLFREVIKNQAAALFSLRTGPNVQGMGADVGDPIYYESIGGGIGTWATQKQVDQHGVKNLDGLEVWGTEGSDDADRFSYFNDPTIPTGVEVWTGTDSGGGLPLTAPWITPYILTSELAAAFGNPSLEQYLDIDALMAMDTNGSVLTWDMGDEILFSLWPTSPLDPIGDAVWHWKNGQAPVFFNHGGHDWTPGWTAMLDPNGIGYNVDALEAVATPEPGTLVLLGTGLAGLMGRRRKNKKG